MKTQIAFAIAAAICACAILIASLSYAFSQYVRVRDHNLDVITQMRLCADPDLSGQAVTRCTEIAKGQWIGNYPKSEE